MNQDFWNFDPEEYILPVDGMVIIFPAEIPPVNYSGTKERTIIGMNFWAFNTYPIR